MSIEIGDIQLEDCALLVPLSGIKDMVFRRIIRRYGAALVFSEIVVESRTAVWFPRERVEDPDAMAVMIMIAGTFDDNRVEQALTA
ncbi:MAG: hypothetical protein GDA49_03020 [Rhodospirillales bacterium]|nr:hypothetical protein [Rhodospirillales bacterium]